MTHENLIEQLNDIYYQETWHEERLDRIALTRWHVERLKNGELITVSDGELLVGYCEFFKTRGMCFVNNIFILPAYRRGRTIRMIKNRLFEVCKDCKVFFGERNKKDKKFPEAQLRSNHGK